MKRLGVILIVILLAACGAEQSQSQSVHFKKDRSSFTAEELAKARLWLREHPNHVRRGWKRGIILAVATGDRAPCYCDWYALMLTDHGFRGLEAGPDAWKEDFSLLLSRRDAIVWDDSDHDDTISPGEFRLVEKDAVSSVN